MIFVDEYFVRKISRETNILVQWPMDKIIQKNVGSLN